jgi:hypothetical protein
VKFDDRNQCEVFIVLDLYEYNTSYLGKLLPTKKMIRANGTAIAIWPFFNLQLEIPSHQPDEGC